MLSYNKHETTNKEICEESFGGKGKIVWTASEAVHKLCDDRKTDRDSRDPRMDY